MSFKIILLSVSLLLSATLFGVTIKIGSLAPTGSPWDKALRQIASEWKKISKGKVKVKIYPGAIAGSEDDMIRKMRIGQLGGATLTGAGMSQLIPEIMALSIPLVLKNDKEFYHIIDKVGPEFEKKMEKKGVKIITWSNAGWLKYFSKTPIYSPSDLKKLKMAASPDDAKRLQVLRKIGFNVIPINHNDTMTALSSGMIEAIYSPPLISASFQWFASAKHMLNMKLSPLVSSIVISMRNWKKIPSEMQEEMLKFAKEKKIEERRVNQLIEKRDNILQFIENIVEAQKKINESIVTISHEEDLSRKQIESLEYEKGELQLIENENERVSHELSQLRHQIKGDGLEDLVKKVERTEKSILRLRDKVGSLDVNLGRLDLSRENLESELQALQERIESIKNELSKLGEISTDEDTDAVVKKFRLKTEVDFLKAFDSVNESIVKDITTIKHMILDTVYGSLYAFSYDEQENNLYDRNNFRIEELVSSLSKSIKEQEEIINEKTNDLFRNVIQNTLVEYNQLLYL